VRAGAATLGILAALAASRAAAVEMTADVWKRQVLQEEPILVRVELTNRSERPVQVVPPYVRPHVRDTGYPLTLWAADASGGWREPRLAPGGAYWVREFSRPEAAPLVRSPWVLDSGATAVVWYSLNMLYDLSEPGRYHLKLRYESTPDMVYLLDRGARPAPDELWLGTLEADLGWLEILEPPETERDTAAFLSGHSAACAPSPNADPFGLTKAINEKWPGSAYLPYAEFYAMWAEARRGRSHHGFRQAGLEELRQRAEAFRAAHPDFPLNHQLDTVVALYVYGLTPFPQRTLRVMGGTKPPTRESVLRRYEAAGPLREAARASGDRGVMAEIEARIGWFELVYKSEIEAALAGREPE